jgi:phosphinothricin acetyltransferase
MLIRPARTDDLPRATEIYNHYVVGSHVTFDTAPFTTAGRMQWFQQFDGARYQCLVAVADQDVIGYACSTPLKPKAAYETSVEVSIYLDPAASGRGVGTALYEQLLPALGDQDLHRAYAVIAQPNPASMTLHERFGFHTVSRLTEVGRKFDRYWDVVWMERALG